MDDPDPKTSEPLSFADVLNAELHLLIERRKVIFRPSTGLANRDALGEDHHLDPLRKMREARIGILAETSQERAEDDPIVGPHPPIADEDTIVARTRVRALDRNLTGLAFSGGGIRSASFAVGMLQGLAALKLLRFFDILSTVSGGGYAGGWLVTWMRREGDPINVEHQLNTNRIEQGGADRLVTLNLPGPVRVTEALGQVVDEEPEPIRHLRRYSSYLNPEPGPFTADTWTLIAIYMRNALINLLLILPAVLTCVLFIRLIFRAYNAVIMGGNPPLIYVMCGAGLFLILYGFTVNALVLTSMGRRGHYAKGASQRQVVVKEVLPLLGAAVLLTMTYQPMLEAFRVGLRRLLEDLGFSSASIGQASYLSVVTVFGHAVLFGTMMFIVEMFGGSKKRSSGKTKAPGQQETSAGRGRMPIWLAAILAGLLGGMLVSVTEEVLRFTIDRHWLSVLALAGPPSFLLVAVVSMAAMVALTAEPSTEAQREWWGRFGALLLMTAVGWTVCVGVVLYGPALLLGSHQLVNAALATGWVGITAAGVKAGRSAATESGRGNRRLEIVAAVAPPVFLVGLLALAATAAVLIVDDVGGVRSQPTFARTCSAYLYVIRGATWGRLGFWFFFFLLVSGFGLYFVDVNLFSLHALYANRLTRAFLGASRRRREWEARWTDATNGPLGEAPHRDQRVLAGAPTGVRGGEARDPNPVTQFDPRDDLDLVDLRIGGGDASGRYWGPHVIFNTAMNLVGGGELAWRDRKAESFTLTPMFCGARTTGYAYTSQKTRDRLTVGRTVAISGAAVDPNMNYHQSASVTALLTVFNARLGIWIQNPNRQTWPRNRSLLFRWLRGKLGRRNPRPPGARNWTFLSTWLRMASRCLREWRPNAAPWSAHGASFGFWLFNELLGETSQRKEYVHISDGGHFENLGVYELVKRRCRYVVAVDAADDPSDTSDNLGILVRLCRVDLGIRIDVETTPLRVEGPDGLSRAHVVIGRIRYDDVDNGQTPGMLVYIKCTMTGDEPADVRQYAKLHPEFPRQSTGDQSFDEDQFESYRALGTHTAINVFGIASQSLYGGEDEGHWWAAQRAEWSGPGQEARGYEGFFFACHRRIFNAVRNRWTEPPLIGERARIESSRAYLGFQETLRTSDSLEGLDRDLYSDLPSLGRDVPRGDLHAIEQAVRIMAETWHGLGLKGHDDAHIGAGHLNMFRRLTGSDAFRRFWPLIRPQYSRDFVRFCERQLYVRVPRPRLLPAAERSEDIESLGREFAREWPECARRPGPRAAAVEADIPTRVANAVGFALDGAWVPAAFVVVQGPEEEDPRLVRAYEIPSGLVILNRSRREESERLGARYELLIWIGRAQRSSGIGERVRVSDPIRQLTEGLRGQSVVVRYPSTVGVGGEDLNRVRWLSFFSLLGFKPHRRRPLRPEQEWILVKAYD